MKRPGIGIGVFVVRNGKFLMLKRQGAHGAGTWSVPGGWMELGESFEDTAKREVKEETGLKINNVRFGGVTNTVFSDDKVHSITVWIVSDHVSGEPKILESEKTSELLWCNFDTLPKPLFEPWDELLESEFVENIKSHIENNLTS